MLKLSSNLLETETDSISCLIATSKENNPTKLYNKKKQLVAIELVSVKYDNKTKIGIIITTQL